MDSEKGLDETDKWRWLSSGKYFDLYGWNALKGQKPLAQGIALGNYGRKPVALFYSNWASFERIF